VGTGLGRFSYTPLIPALVESGALTATEAGYVAAFNLAGYLVGALAAPRFGARFGATAVLRASLIVALASLVASIAPWGFTWLSFWRFVIGVAVAVMMIHSLSIATRSAKTGRLGAATGIVFTGVGVGILLSGTLVPLLLETGLAAAWGGLAAIGAVGVAVALWGWTAADDPRREASQPLASLRLRRPPAATLRLIFLVRCGSWAVAVGPAARNSIRCVLVGAAGDPIVSMGTIALVLDVPHALVCL
jgi:MFS family permease